MGVLEDIRENYPTLAFLINDPEVGPLLRDAVDPNKGFSPQAFQAKLYQTKWFKSRSVQQRSFDIMSHTDPGEFKRQVAGTTAQVKAFATKMGLRLSDAEVRFMATNFLRDGIEVGSDAFTANIARYAKTAKGDRFGAGTVDGAAMQVKDIARQEYYFPISDKDAKRWGIDMAFGIKDEAAFRARMAERAASLYPHLKNQLMAGQSMDDLFSGHREIIARELEISPNSIDFTKQWKKVLHQVDPKTNTPRPMTLHEAQTLARQDKRWWETSGGREADAGMANFMLKMFGKRA